MNNPNNQKDPAFTDRLMEPINGVFMLALVYQAFIETLKVDFSLSRMLSMVFMLSLFTSVLNSFKIKSNTTLISLFFLSLILGSFKAFKVFSLPVETAELFHKTYCGIFLTSTFLIIITNLSNRNLEWAITFNASLALFCSGSSMFEHFGYTIPIRLYDYIPVLFLVSNLIIYASRNKPAS